MIVCKSNILSTKKYDFVMKERVFIQLHQYFLQC